MTTFIVAGFAAIVLSAIAIAIISNSNTEQRRFAAIPMLVAMLLVLSSLAPSAQAAAADATVAVARRAGQSTEALDQGRTKTGVGTQFQGLEYPDAKGTPLSDRAISQRVRAKAPDTLVMSVSNGSVRLSGEVTDRQTAEEIVEMVKAIPGVHEVAYDIGLTEDDNALF